MGHAMLVNAPKGIYSQLIPGLLVCTTFSRSPSMGFLSVSENEETEEFARHLVIYVCILNMGHCRETSYMFFSCYV
jgi:hypothetical protein